VEYINLLHVKLGQDEIGILSRCRSVSIYKGSCVFVLCLVSVRFGLLFLFSLWTVCHVICVCSFGFWRYL